MPKQVSVGPYTRDQIEILIIVLTSSMNGPKGEGGDVYSPQNRPCKKSPLLPEGKPARQ